MSFAPSHHALTSVGFAPDKTSFANIVLTVVQAYLEAPLQQVPY